MEERFTVQGFTVQGFTVERGLNASGPQRK